METKLKIKENWTTLKKELKHTYAALTDLDLTYAEGREDELVAAISKKIGKTKEEVSKVINELQTKMKGKSVGEKAYADAEKSGVAGKSHGERDGVHSEKSQFVRKYGDEGKDVDADPRHIEASKKH